MKKAPLAKIRTAREIAKNMSFVQLVDEGLVGFSGGIVVVGWWGRSAIGEMDCVWLLSFCGIV